MKVLVTGGSGFIGRAVDKELDKKFVVRQIEVYEPTVETIDRLIELGYSVHPKVENQLTIVSW